MNSLGQRIKFLREEKGMSQNDVAKSTGISRSNIGKIENDKISPNCDAVIELAKLFKVSTDFLLLGKESAQNVAIINSDTSSLSEEEKDLVLAFRHFDELDKELIKNTVDSLLKRLEKSSTLYSYTPGDEEAAAEEYEEYNIKKQA